jgi:collagenase-like PrtC family protease
MRYAAPVNSADEVEKLYEAGADELYCGFFDVEWQKSYGRHDSISRRQGEANYASFDELAKTVSEASKLHMPVYLAVNSRYTRLQYDSVLELIRKWQAVGGNGIIIRDIGLLDRLNGIKTGSGLKLIVSLLFPVFNRFAVGLLKDYGVSRIVLPRSLSVSEMKLICSESKDIEFEAMVMGDKCRMIDGFCRSIHADSSRKTFSEIDYSEGCVHLCTQYARSQEDPCAACLISEIENAGVSVGKIGGRGLPLEKRIEWLRFLKDSQRLSDEDKKKSYLNTFSHNCICYYENSNDCICYYDKNMTSDITETQICEYSYLSENMIGHHSCIGALNDIKKYLDNSDKNEQSDPVFVFPPITPAYCTEFQTLIELICCRYTDHKAEIVLNDYGAAVYCGKLKTEGMLKAKLTLGLLLSGQDTDPFYEAIESADADTRKDKEKILKHLSEPSVFSQTKFMDKYGISGIELCRQPITINRRHTAYEKYNIRLYDISVLSVKACCGNCKKCGETPVIRYDRKIFSDRNLLLYR